MDSWQALYMKQFGQIHGRDDDEKIDRSLDKKEGNVG